MAARFGAVARQFSTSATRGSLVNAPIQLFGVEGRYAHALYSAASKEKKLDSIEKEIQDFQKFVSSEAKFADFLANPTVQRKKKRDVLRDIMTLQKASPILINLFTAMAENGRINKMNSILGAFGKLMSAHRGEITCTVTTAKALDNAGMKELQVSLKGFVKPGETLQLETKVDPSIIGGMVVNIGDKYVDMSTASKIRAYTKLIQQAV